MSLTGKFLFIASMNVTEDKEGIFNEVYDFEHIPNLLEVPGVISIFRTIKEELTLSIGGSHENVVFDDEPKYSAYYEIESPSVLISPKWSAAIEAGRWPIEVRPYTLNRRHILRKITSNY